VTTSTSPVDDSAEKTAVDAEAGDPGVFGWGLTVVLWVECVIAIVAALAGSRSPVEAGIFAGYAAILGGVATARSGLLPRTRWPTVGALLTVLAMHVLPWAFPLGRQPPRILETLLYVLAVGAGLVALRREQNVEPSREAPLPPWLRALEVAGRSFGLLFLAGLILLLLDPLIHLPFSHH